jgi:hypothetical protein
MKTKGQRLYEYKSPVYYNVVEFYGRRTATDAFMVKNERHVPWQFLTQSCKDGWEDTARGHHLFSEEGE